MQPHCVQQAQWLRAMLTKLQRTGRPCQQPSTRHSRSHLEGRQGRQGGRREGSCRSHCQGSWGKQEGLCSTRDSTTAPGNVRSVVDTSRHHQLPLCCLFFCAWWHPLPVTQTGAGGTHAGEAWNRHCHSSRSCLHRSPEERPPSSRPYRSSHRKLPSGHWRLQQIDVCKVNELLQGSRPVSLRVSPCLFFCTGIAIQERNKPRRGRAGRNAGRNNE